MLRRTNPVVAVAQFHALRRQVPFLYALLTVNGWAVAYTHFGIAPDSLTIGASMILTGICLTRMIAWIMPMRTAITAEAAIGKLRRTTLFAGLLAVAFVAWSLMLDRYGGAFARGHVALFIAITVIGCIFCLMSLPQAALLVTVLVTIPYMVYYLWSGEPVFIAIATNIALVTAVMIHVLLSSFRSFTIMVESRAELASKQAEAQRLSDENARLAHTDSLTGLPNRRFFFSRLEELIAQRRKDREPFVVGVMDLDRFKPVNDTYGHVLGDRLLGEIGDRLYAVSGPDMVIARLGGDEFGLILTHGAGDAMRVGQMLCDLIGQPFMFDDIRITLGCSCGMAIFPDAGTSAHELFDRSDYALYHVKSRRAGGCALFSLEHETRIRSERAIEAALQSADFEAEMEVHFQPIVDTDRMAVIGVEALARWTSPTVGPVSPERFIGIAERVGLIHAITLTLFEKALRQAETLPPGIGLSFNLSANDIASPETIATIVALTRAAEIPPETITFELTETALMRDFDLAVDALHRLRAMGAHVALDDFGTGYSSLSYLRQLPLDKIKVDRSFVADLHEPSRRNIVTAILGLCKTMALDCIVEGIENMRQLEQMRELGCHMAQGFLFARPMTVDALRAWLGSDDIGRHLTTGGGPARPAPETAPARRVA
ncbi:putative bifunctional diguanylate cyclase/phosphodiesterase [Sphingobium aquiterrae]|uniref:putative bifunctional diguanylate cyclase/phosphodiesterase n=1 Tax=Sphingobium aquiterrae TaxID=2038656 RepID=UPI00301B295A